MADCSCLSLRYKSCETDESFEVGLAAAPAITQSKEAAHELTPIRAQMSTDEMRQGNLQLPGPLAKQAQVVNDFHSTCSDAAHVLLYQLADALGLPLQDHHRLHQPSESGLKLIAEPSVPLAANVIENKHHDSGTLTMLFYDTWSLHVCLPRKTGQDTEEQEWVFVPPPVEGVALVHGAKSLARLSNGRFQAPLHRVTQPSDGAGKRYFLSYFLRPEDRLRDEWAVAAT